MKKEALPTTVIELHLQRWCIVFTFTAAFHTGGGHLPLSLATALLICGVGVFVFAIIVYDAYRTYWSDFG